MIARAFARAVLGVAVFFVARPAAAQREPSPPENAGNVTSDPAPPVAPDDSPAAGVLAPQLLSEAAAPYPDGAHGDAEVELELVVDREGKVTRVAVIRGDTPFTAAAERAAATWRFAPARREGQAIAARIRLVATFHDPVSTPSSATDTTAKSPGEGLATEPNRALPSPATSTAPVAAPVSITVIGERAKPGTTLSINEVRQLPGAFGDPFRAIEALPGVTPIASGVPYFYVRGAPPGNVGYFFDGVRVPVLFHAGLGPAVIAPWFVDDVTLYPGGYPARYGRFAGGIVTAEAAEPKNAWRGMASVRVFDAGAMVEAPFAEGRGNVMLGGRYSYTAAVFSLLAPGFDLGYWDYQARAHYDITPDDRVSVLTFGAFDFASQEENGRKNTIYDVRFHRVDVRYDRRTSATSRLRLAATVGDDRTVISNNTDPGLQDGTFLVRAKSIGGRAEYTNRLSPSVELRAGADLVVDKNELQSSPLYPETSQGQYNDVPSFTAYNQTFLGTRADVTLDLGSGVSVVPGARFDVYRAQGATVPAFEPRVSARFRISDTVTLFHDFGLAHQLPSFVVPLPGFQPRIANGLQRSLQASSGVRAKLPSDITATVTAFQNVLFNGTDPLAITSFQVRDSNSIIDDDARSLGHSFGAEVMVKRDLTRRLGGFVAYTLARSVRSVGPAHGPAAVDRTHVLNFALGYDLGRNWRAGVRAVFYTGVPARVAYLAATASPPRSPSFYRFDWRLEKRWPFENQRYISLVFEFLNTTLQRETTRSSCTAYYCKEDRVGPVSAPSIGVEAAF